MHAHTHIHALNPSHTHTHTLACLCSHLTHTPMYTILSHPLYMYVYTHTFIATHTHTHTHTHACIHIGGETSADDGWLVGVSELHLRLLPPGAENEPPIQIASLPSNYSQYSVKLKPFAYGSKQVCNYRCMYSCMTLYFLIVKLIQRNISGHFCKVVAYFTSLSLSSFQKDVACSDVRVKKMDRQRGDCDFLSQSDQGCYFNQETQGLTFWTQAQNFDKIVSNGLKST